LFDFMLSALRQAARHRADSGPKLEIGRVWVSERERKAARLSPANVQQGMQEFHANGLVILENAVGSYTVDHVLKRDARL
jgi:hypothetical protein